MAEVVKNLARVLWGKLMFDYIVVTVKGRMNQKFDIFYFSSILVKYV